MVPGKTVKVIMVRKNVLDMLRQILIRMLRFTSDAKVQIKMEKSFGLPELENQTLLKEVEELILMLQEQANIKK